MYGYNRTMPTGRPSKLTPDILEEIIKRLYEGASARSIFKDDRMPTWQNFCKFKNKPENESFRDQYELALADGMQGWESEIREIASDDSRDFQPDGKGGVKSDNTAVNRDRLRVDTMKWIMCKRMSKIYGEKTQTEVTGKDGAPFQPVLNITIKKDE